MSAEKSQDFSFPHRVGGLPGSNSNWLKVNKSTQVKSSQVKSQVKSSQVKSSQHDGEPVICVPFQHWLIECDTHWSITRNRKNVYIW